jgi:hypothetical protein
MDIKSAFLNGDLKDVIYVQQPPGFIDDNNPDKVLRLQRPSMNIGKLPKRGMPSSMALCYHSASRATPLSMACTPVATPSNG